MSKIGEIVHWHRDHVEDILSDATTESYKFDFRGIRIRPGIYIGVLDARYITRARRRYMERRPLSERIKFHLHKTKFHAMMLGRLIEKKERLEEKYSGS